MTSPIDPNLPQQIMIWRQKAADGSLEQKDMIEIVRTLRAGRMKAAEAAASSAKTRKKAIVEIPSADDLLGELMGGSNG